MEMKDIAIVIKFWDLEGLVMKAGQKAATVWIGVDIGTTGARAVAYHSDGTAICTAAELYPLYTPHPSWAEQKVSEIHAAVEMVIEKAAKLLACQGKTADGIALSTVMHSFMALDEGHRPISEMMTWADSRSSELVRLMRQDEALCHAFYQKTCCPVHATYPLSKILWLRQNRPEIFSRMQFVGSIKDYMFKQLTNEWVLDRSTASASGIYNAHTLTWDEEILRYLQLDESAMPRVVSTMHGQALSKAAAGRLALPEGIPVVIGATDGVLVNVGIGAVEDGQLSATIGTSGALRMLTKEPRIDAKGRTWCYNLTDELWVAGGAINNGGITLRWLRDEVFQYDEAALKIKGQDPYDLMTLAAGKIPAGADGLILLPFFTGERAPHWNSDLRAAFFGLSLKHQRAHLIRATLEGVCYSLNSVMAALRDFGEVKDIRVSGSFTKSPLWLQIMADVFNEKITLPTISEGAAFGAAVLGFISEGTIKNITEAAKLAQVAKIYRPDAERTAVYQELYAIYERLYQKLEPEFKEIVDYQNRR